MHFKKTDQSMAALFYTLKDQIVLFGSNLNLLHHAINKQEKHVHFKVVLSQSFKVILKCFHILVII